jgi:hypothetical protein
LAPGDTTETRASARRLAVRGFSAVLLPHHRPRRQAMHGEEIVDRNLETPDLLRIHGPFRAFDAPGDLRPELVVGCRTGKTGLHEALESADRVEFVPLRLPDRQDSSTIEVLLPRLGRIHCVHLPEDQTTGSNVALPTSTACDGKLNAAGPAPVAVERVGPASGRKLAVDCGWSRSRTTNRAGSSLVGKLSGYALRSASRSTARKVAEAQAYGISIAAVYRVVDEKIVTVDGSSGVSPLDAPAETRALEAEYAKSWYANITADTFG